MLIHDQDLPPPGRVHGPDGFQELCARASREYYRIRVAVSLSRRKRREGRRTLAGADRRDERGHRRSVVWSVWLAT